MAETATINFSAFVSGLSPSALAFFRLLFENAQQTISKNGPQAVYQKSLNDIFTTTGCNDIEEAAKDIREILQRKVECMEGDFLYFFPFVTSICIEEGFVKYSLPKEVEDVMPQVPVFGKA